MERELRAYADLKGVAVPVGRLWVKDRAGKESATFEYEASWLKHPQRFALAPNLMLTTGKFHSANDLFNAFTDPAPDRWGRKLMRHFEVESAKTEGRTPRTLLGSDFLAGVDDEVRLGALRFKRPGDDKFVAHTGRPVPPLIELAELLSATDRIEKGKPRKKDIQLVLAPGGSLGGARPKATVRNQGKLHIAKFPWVRDEWPVIQWEAALLELAAAAGVTTPPARLERVGTKPVLLMDRFDREGSDVRVPFMSAMTALDAKDHSEDRSYLEILDVIRQFGAFPKEDARELWRRMVFNVLVSNTDDHLRNHGFLWAGEGWRLAPAYDMNPSPPHINPRIHVLALNELDHTSSIDTVMSVSKDFGLALAEAKAIAGEVATAVSGWKTTAAKARLSKDDITFMADAFEHDDLRTALAFGPTTAPLRSGGAKGQKRTASPGAAKATKRAPAKIRRPEEALGCWREVSAGRFAVTATPDIFPEMWLETARAALRSGKCLELRYDGYSRVVEVHAAGYTKDGNAIMRVWQVRGGSVSGERTGWKLMRADETFSAHLTDEPSRAPRPGFKKGDAAMDRLVCET